MAEIDLEAIDARARLLAKLTISRKDGTSRPAPRVVYLCAADIPTLLTALRERDAEIAGLRKDIAAKRRALIAAKPLVQNFAGDSDDNNQIYELVCAALSQAKGT